MLMCSSGACATFTSPAPYITQGIPPKCRKRRMSAPVEQVVLHIAREWIPFPRGRVSRVHGVGVGVEQDGASLRCPAPYADDVRSILVRALFPDVIAVRFRLLARGLPRVHV